MKSNQNLCVEPYFQLSFECLILRFLILDSVIIWNALLCVIWSVANIKKC